MAIQKDLPWLAHVVDPECESFQQLWIDDRSVLEWGVSAPESRGMDMQ